MRYRWMNESDKYINNNNFVVKLKWNGVTQLFDSVCYGLAHE